MGVMTIANLHYLRKYSMFESTQELNYHVKMHTNRRYYDMNETQRRTLQVIAQYGVKHHGACHLKLKTIMEAIDRSESAARNVIKALVRLGVVRKIEMMRPISGGNGANIYVILPYEDKGLPANDGAQTTGRVNAVEATPAKDEEESDEKESANLSSYYLNSINTYSKPSFRKSPYSIFKDSIHTFLGKHNNKDNQRLISRMYGVYLAQTKALSKVYDSTDLLTFANKAIRVTFMTSKRRKLRNIAGYFNGVLSNLLDDFCDEEMARILGVTS